MIWLIVIYIMCGLGTSLALDDEDDNYGPTARMILFFVFWVLWPAAFMFAVTMAIRAISTGEPNLRRQPKATTNQTG